MEQNIQFGVTRTLISLYRPIDDKTDKTLFVCPTFVSSLDLLKGTAEDSGPAQRDGVSTYLAKRTFLLYILKMLMLEGARGGGVSMK